MKRFKYLFVTVAFLLFASAIPEKTTTIFIIGDSTAANKDISKGKLERGWGMVLQSYFDDNIRVDNRALNGRSSLSFINEGRWDAVLKSMKPGDYVIIQFGHNDEKPKADRHTDPGSTFGRREDGRGRHPYRHPRPLSCGTTRRSPTDERPFRRCQQNHP